jgi:hypothetical protein
MSNKLNDTIPPKPDFPCPCCKGTVYYWRQYYENIPDYGDWLCATCRPKPDWIKDDEEDNQET